MDDFYDLNDKFIDDEDLEALNTFEEEKPSRDGGTGHQGW